MDFWYNLQTQAWVLLISPSQWVFVWVLASIITAFVLAKLGGSHAPFGELMVSAIVIPVLLWFVVYGFLGAISVMIWLVTH